MNHVRPVLIVGGGPPTSATASPWLQGGALPFEARAVERTRSLLLHYDALRIALRDARMDVHNLKDRLTVCASRGLEEGA